MAIPSRFKVIVASKGKTKSIEIDKDTCVLGRASTCDIPLDDELISRQHLRISLHNDDIMIEELGSSNGSWLNGEKMTAGKKVPYIQGNFLKLGSINGISLTIESLASVVKLPVAKSSEPEKTLVYNMSQFESLKVANGSVSSPLPETKKAAKPQKIMKLVEADSLDNQDATVKINHTKTISHKAQESKKSFEDQVKLLVSKESESLRASSIKEAEAIKQKANAEKTIILEEAAVQAKKIIDHAKSESARMIKAAEMSVSSINDQNKRKEEESHRTIKELSNHIAQNEEKIKHLKHEEITHVQRIKTLKEDFSTLKERIKNEHALIEDLKLQTATHRKNSELKIEEYALEERRVKAKIETEVIEARSQVARILAEAEKSQIQKDILAPEIAQLKNDKDRLEREINEAQINFRRMEYDIERLGAEHAEAQSKAAQSQSDLLVITQELLEQKERHAATEETLAQKEAEINKRLGEIQQVSNKIIEGAKKQSLAIIAEANATADLALKNKEEVLKDLEVQKAKFYADFQIEKDLKYKALNEELDASKNKTRLEIDKLEHKKNNIINEMKWLEENAKKKCDNLIQKAQMDIEASKKLLMTENEKHKLKIAEDIMAQKKQWFEESQKLKEEALKEAENLKLAAQEQCLKMKQKLQKTITDTQTEIQQEKNLITILEKETENVLKKHREALEKTEALMDDNYLAAEEKIKLMLEDARLKAVELDRVTREQNARDYVAMNEYKRIELNKIEEEKAQMDGYNIKSLQNNATSIAETVEDFITREMMKSKNFLVDDKFINKMSKRVNQMVSDLLLGRYETPNISIPTKSAPKQEREIRSVFVFIAAALIIGALCYIFPEEATHTKEYFRDVLKENNITVVDDTYHWVTELFK